MKVYVCYVIWNKGAHIPWLCNGIKKAIPKGSIVDFVLDNCTDNSEALIHEMTKRKINEYGSLIDHDVRIYNSTKKLRCPNTNDAMERFMASDCAIFLTPQDDMMIQDKHIVPNLINLYQHEANVGLIGMRDGLDLNRKFYSSNHSPGGDNTHYLRSGEYQHVDFVNDGPLAFSKHLIDQVGYFDLTYWAHYLDNDYCFRANEKGLRNFVMGAEIVHEKWGCKVCGEIQQSEVWNQEYSTHDYEVYKSKWPTKL